MFDAFRRVIAEEGLTSMWSGCSPTIVRAMALNLGMLATYEDAKERLSKRMSAN